MVKLGRNEKMKQYYFNKILPFPSKPALTSKRSSAFEQDSTPLKL